MRRRLRFLNTGLALPILLALIAGGLLISPLFRSASAQRGGVVAPVKGQTSILTIFTAVPRLHRQRRRITRVARYAVGDALARTDTVRLAAFGSCRAERFLGRRQRPGDLLQ